jgi:hypothetical protein
VNNIKQNEFTLNVKLKSQKVEVEAPNKKKMGAK